MLARLITLTLLVFASPALADDKTLDPAVRQETMADTICIPGYTTAVRPPYFVTASIKRDKLLAAGLSWDDAPNFELDHIVPLCLGGSSDPSNLQLQPWDEARRKDRVEAQACRCVCAGKATLAEAQNDLATDWKAAYQKYATMVCGRWAVGDGGTR
jgi:hypothetical protein